MNNINILTSQTAPRSSYTTQKVLDTPIPPPPIPTMHIFITGGTGFIGSNLIPELLAHNHTVLALVRSPAADSKIQSLGGKSLHGTLTDLEILKEGATTCDAVIHCAFNNDFISPNSFPEACAIDLAAINAIGAALQGTDKPFIVTSGTLAVHAEGRAATEDEHPIPGSNPRMPAEVRTRELAHEGVRSMIMRLSPCVHGDGDMGFMAKFVAVAAESKVAAYVGDGKQRWPSVHVKDAAVLYRLAIEKGTAGAVYHAVHDEGLEIRELAGVVGKKLGIPVGSKKSEEAIPHFGFLGFCLGIDDWCESRKTREALGWEPVRCGLVEDLEEGGYLKPENIGKVHKGL